MMNDGKQQSTFLFHDYETFGTHPALDRPAQFAAIRTDSEFNVIGAPVLINGTDSEAANNIFFMTFPPLIFIALSFYYTECSPKGQ